MIEFKTGNIIVEEADALVNTVNCVGVMGRGIALQFRKAFPENYKIYRQACRRAEVRPGHVMVVPTGQLAPPRYIINFPTKRHWRGKSRITDIEAGLASLVEQIETLGIASVAIPPLGCGLGGLDWTEVRPLIETALARLPDVDAIVFEPGEAPEPAAMPKSAEAPAMTEGRAALIGLMDRYIRGSMDPSISLLEIHKLMYFLQEAGQGLKLEYAKAPYGPYAENLRHVLNRIEGHFVSGYSDGGDAPDKILEMLPGAVEDAGAYLESHEELRGRFDRVTDLVEGFETPFGLELLATVHWVAAHENMRRPQEVEDATYAWNTRKRRFNPSQIRLALRVLTERSWLAER